MVSAENGREEKIINGLEGGTTETTQSEKQRNRMIKKKKEQSHKPLWDCNKRSKILLITTPERGPRARLKKYLKK